MSTYKFFIASSGNKGSVYYQKLRMRTPLVKLLGLVKSVTKMMTKVTDCDSLGGTIFINVCVSYKGTKCKRQKVTLDTLKFCSK